MPNIPTLIARLFDDTDADAAELAVKSTPSEPDSRTSPAGGRRGRETRVTSAGCTGVAILSRDHHQPQQKATP
jgi:hypothetical protein